jgi:hypothetical protein
VDRAHVLGAFDAVLGIELVGDLAEFPGAHGRSRRGQLAAQPGGVGFGAVAYGFGGGGL